MYLMFAFIETDISSRFFFSYIMGSSVLAFFIFLLFWLPNQKACWIIQNSYWDKFENNI